MDEISLVYLIFRGEEETLHAYMAIERSKAETEREKKRCRAV